MIYLFKLSSSTDQSRYLHEPVLGTVRRLLRVILIKGSRHIYPNSNDSIVIPSYIICVGLFACWIKDKCCREKVDTGIQHKI